MKKIISLSLLLVLFLSSCSIDWNDEKDKKITTQNNKISKLEKQIEDYKKEKEDDLFKKKQECEKYKNGMFTFAKEFRSEIYEIDEIFYSISWKSCYFIAKQSGWWELLFDYLSQSCIAWFNSPIRCYDIEDENIKNHCYRNIDKDQEEYNNKIKELKWE